MTDSPNPADPDQTLLAANGEPATTLSVATLRDQIRPAVLSLLSLTLLTAVLFPLLLFLLAPPLFPGRARGSLLMRGSIFVGSELVGQNFISPAYFHPDASAAGTGYDAASSGGLMVGRTPEYLGKAITPGEAKLLALYAGYAGRGFDTHQLGHQHRHGARAGLVTNTGPHAMTEVLFAYASNMANNGMTMVGLNANSVFYNMTTAVAMLAGRFGWLP